MIKIEVNTNSNGECVTEKCNVKGHLEDLIRELVLIETALIHEMVVPSKLKQGVTVQSAMLDMSDTVNRCVRAAIESSALETNETPREDELHDFREVLKDIAHKKLQPETSSPSTLESVLNSRLGISGNKLQQDQMVMKELVDKWYPRYTKSILSKEEHAQVRAEVHEAGFTMEDFIDKLLDRVGEEAMK